MLKGRKREVTTKLCIHFMQFVQIDSYKRTHKLHNFRSLQTDYVIYAELHAFQILHINEQTCVVS
jgi:hypothetical protein